MFFNLAFMPRKPLDILEAKYASGSCRGWFYYPRQLPHGECGVWGSAPRFCRLVETEEWRKRVRKATHSPTPLGDTKPVGEHLACVVHRLSEYRTVACWRVSQGRDLEFTRMDIDERF